MQIKQMLFPMMSMELSMAPCSHLHAQVQTPVSQMEKLDRGLVALPAQDKGIFLSWRLLGTDSKNVCFDIERDGKIIAHQVKLTNYTDRKGSAASSYRIITYQKEPRMDAPAEREVSKAVKPWNDLYRSLPINRPAGGVTPDGKSYEYTPNDCSVGDVDGDGEYEIILKWDPTNAHDNSHDGYTGEVIFDCYKLDGTQLWRINLGKNIRAGAHYTQFLVYDFDGDGKAEMVCKTSAGSVDARSRFVSDAATDDGIRSIDNHADYRNSRGRIMTGPELLTVFHGETGKAMHTIWYQPNRAFGTGNQGGRGGASGERIPCLFFCMGRQGKLWQPWRAIPGWRGFPGGCRQEAECRDVPWLLYPLLSLGGRFRWKGTQDQMAPCFADSQRLEGDRCRRKGAEGSSWM